MSGPDDDLEEKVGRKAERRDRARREGRHTVWFGLGMFGLVGWAVAVPTLAGVALGLWLDARYPGGPSWTITGLVAGVALGCLNAWWWVQRAGGRGNGGGGSLR
jgi:ATP synthase protein I